MCLSFLHRHPHTIFYSGTFNVDKDVPTDKAHAMTLLFPNGVEQYNHSMDASVMRSIANVRAPNNMASPMRSHAPVGRSAIFKQHSSLASTAPPLSPLSVPHPERKPQPTSKRTQAGLCFAREASLDRFLEKAKDRCRSQDIHEAIQTLDLIDSTAFIPVVIGLLERCMDEENLEAGQELLDILVKRGLESDASIGNYIVHMFIHFEVLLDAKQAFDIIDRPNIYVFSAIILAHARLGHDGEAINLYKRLQTLFLQPDGHVYVAVLKACNCVTALKMGRSIHASIIECGLMQDCFIDSALMVMYMNCGSFVETCIVFERSMKLNTVMWNVLISGYTQHIGGYEALSVLECMQLYRVEPDQATFVCALKACSITASLQKGEQFHFLVLEAGLESDAFVGSTLIDMYVKCAALENAMMVFGRLSKRNLVTWTALIAGHVHHEHGLEALHLFQSMLQEGLVPNRVTLVSIIKACSGIAALHKGRECHACIIESGLEADAAVGSALTDMYGKCGTMKEARTFLNRSPRGDVVMWSALIAGYVQNNDVLSALECFKHMQDADCKPDAITFLSLLSACRRAGFLQEGCRFFKMMTSVYDIYPYLEHFNTIADLLGHLGCMEEAEDLLETIPFSNVPGWRSFLFSCRKHANIDAGRRSFEYVRSTDGTNAAGYLFMEHIYAESGLFNDSAKVKELRKCADGWKKPAKASIEVGKEVHEFSAGDTAHVRNDDIHAKLRTLTSQIEAKAKTNRGYSVEDLELMHGGIDASCGHCEKLAIAFGLISIPLGVTIRVAKNIRMCSDCHLFTEHISMSEMREIVIKDSYQTHKFVDGTCSCKSIQ